MSTPRTRLLLQLGLALSVFMTARAAPAAAPVAVVDLQFQGTVSVGLRRALRERLERGLTAAGLPTVDAARLLVARRDRCGEATCWRRVAAQLGCRYLVGGVVQGEARSYMLELWVADGYTGRVTARHREACEICGFAAASATMERAAAALAASVRVALPAPARLLVRTQPPGAILLVDGDAVGATPREVELPAGPHQLAARAEGYLPASRSVTAVAGRTELLELALIPDPGPAVQARPVRRWAGWLSVGAAALGFSAAAALFATNGRPWGCSGEANAVPGGQCRERLDTRAGAWTVTGLGIGFGLAGAYLLYQSYHSK